MFINIQTKASSDHSAELSRSSFPVSIFNHSGNGFCSLPPWSKYRSSDLAGAKFGPLEDGIARFCVAVVISGEYVYNVRMKRKDFYLTEPQIKAMEIEAKRLGITVAELLRRIIDLYFEKKSDDVHLSK